MAAKKDMRRTDLVIPYVEPKDDGGSDFAGTFGSTMPMAAMFTRNKLIGWMAVMTTLLSWLGESASKKSSGTPAYLSVGMSVMSLVVVYLPLFLPPPAADPTGTGAPVPVPVPS